MEKKLEVKVSPFNGKNIRIDVMFGDRTFTYGRNYAEASEPLYLASASRYKPTPQVYIAALTALAKAQANLLSQLQVDDI